MTDKQPAIDTHNSVTQALDSTNNTNQNLSASQRFQEKLQSSKAAFYLGSALVGVARTFIGFPIEHPLDSIKTQWQVKPHHPNEIAIMRDIYQNKGFKGFFAGAIPNITRGLVKNTYRYPLLVGLPNFYKTYLPVSIQERKSLLKLLTGVSIAFWESIITCPIERIKVYFMTTNEKNLSYRQFFQNNQGRLMHELFRGFGPLFARQCMAWTIVLQTDLQVKNYIRRTYNIKEKEKIPAKYLFPGAFVTATTNTIIVMPFDIVKTYLEKRDPTLTYLNTFKTIYNQSGMIGFFTGSRLRFLQYFMNALFISHLLEALESIYKGTKKE